MEGPAAKFLWNGPWTLANIGHAGIATQASLNVWMDQNEPRQVLTYAGDVQRAKQPNANTMAVQCFKGPLLGPSGRAL